MEGTDAAAAAESAPDGSETGAAAPSSNGDVASGESRASSMVSSANFKAKQQHINVLSAHAQAHHATLQVNLFSHADVLHQAKLVRCCEETCC